MLPFRTSIATFWQGNDAYIAVYGASALIACLVISGFEFHNRTSSVFYPKFLIESVALAIGTIAIFTLSMFVSGWYSRLLAGEVFTCLTIGALWYVALYFLNTSLVDTIAASPQNDRSNAHLPDVVLIVPYFAFDAYILKLGSDWKI